jgi:hypothetical protein
MLQQASAQFGIAMAFFIITLIQYQGLSRRLDAIFLQDDWIPDIDLTPEEKADRLRRKHVKVNYFNLSFSQPTQPSFL